MKTQYYTATSLDGFIATEDDSLDWLFPLGDVNDTGYPYSSVPPFRHYSDAPSSDRQDQMGALGLRPTWVFSKRTLPPVPGADLRFVRGDVRSVHEAMRGAAGAKNIWIVGGGDLAGQFFDAGLLDEVIVQIGSVTLGKGKPLFPRRLTSPPLRLLSAKQVGTGFAELRYEVSRGKVESVA